MSNLTLKTPGDIPAIVAAFLGFTPNDSLVILSIGGGPSARVDITDDTVDSAVEAMMVAAPHWSNGIIVAVYSDDVDALDVGHAIALHMPDVPVRVTVTVEPDGTVIDDSGHRHAPTLENMPAEVLAKRTLSSRDEILAEAAETADAETAWIVAREAYRAGDGARAWVYVDRFTELNGGDSVDSTLLRHFLTRAVDPKSDAARAILS